MADVTLTRVNKIYGAGRAAVHAVQDLDLQIRDGEFVALLGPSGCGKTSTLRMIVGLEGISSGDIHFGATRVNDLEPQERNVAMAFETYALYPNFTVEENLAFPLEVRGVADAERRSRARRVAELLRITDILGEKPPALSGGQQQRVSLGRALIRDPSVFILDEVMSHLDAHLKFQMLFDLKRLHRELGRTMVYVTHDQVEALALADRVAVMSNARLQQVGTRNELYDRPANVFVADFIGEPPTNFIEVRRDAANGATTMHATDGDLAFPLSPERAEAVARHGGEAFIVGVRPQNLHLTDAGSPIGGEVAINEYLGERSILTLKNGGVTFQALVPPATRAEAGEAVRFDVALGDVMVFDKETQALVA
ncbi:MAG: ABC transporter ATP-binding protein [Pseudomonadota bacterium]